MTTYIDCFSSPPFPKAWPRAGGIWDQDPILVRDFRAIREFEVQWKNMEQQRASHETGSDVPTSDGLSGALDAYIESLEEDDMF